jgi:hypothetical protein
MPHMAHNEITSLKDQAMLLEDIQIPRGNTCKMSYSLKGIPANIPKAYLYGTLLKKGHG